MIKRGYAQRDFFQKEISAGFTLIELLIVIAIIAILAAVAFVALDPLTRFRTARDSSRWADLSAVLSAIKVNQVDSGGSYITTITNMVTGTVYMIGVGTSGCNLTCTTPVASSTACVDLTALVTAGYIGKVPISPDGSGTWTASTTGYTLQRDTSGIVTARACEKENSTVEIKIAR